MAIFSDIFKSEKDLEDFIWENLHGITVVFGVWRTEWKAREYIAKPIAEKMMKSDGKLTLKEFFEILDNVSKQATVTVKLHGAKNNNQEINPYSSPLTAQGELTDEGQRAAKAIFKNSNPNSNVMNLDTPVTLRDSLLNKAYSKNEHIYGAITGIEAAYQLKKAQMSEQGGGKKRKPTKRKPTKRKPTKRKPAKRKPTKRKPVAKRKTTGKKVRKIHKGPRGGRYYISKGLKDYI